MRILPQGRPIVDTTSPLADRLYDRLRPEISARPFPAWSMSELAALAEEPLGELFRQFPTKDDVGQTLLARACDDVYRHFGDEVDGSAPLKDRLLAFLSLQLEFLAPWRSIFEHQIGRLFMPASGLSRTATLNVQRYNAFVSALLGGDTSAADWRLKVAVPALIGSFAMFNASVWVRWRFDRTSDKSATLAYIHQGLDTFLKGLKAWTGRD
jgi:AcrR family transcriptional regulator